MANTFNVVRVFGPNHFKISSNVNNAAFSAESKFASFSVHQEKSMGRRIIVCCLFSETPRLLGKFKSFLIQKIPDSTAQVSTFCDLPGLRHRSFFLYASVGIFDDRQQQHAHFGMDSFRKIMVQTELLKIVDIKLPTLIGHHVGPLARQSGQQVAVGPRSTAPGFSNFGESMQKHP